MDVLTYVIGVNLDPLLFYLTGQVGYHEGNIVLYLEWDVDSCLLHNTNQVFSFPGDLIYFPSCNLFHSERTIFSSSLVCADVLQ